MQPIEPPPDALTDGVVTVRMRRMDDLVHIAAAADDPEAERWLDNSPQDGPPRTPDQVLEIWRSGTATPLLVVDAASDRPAGLINLQFRPGLDTSVAYRIFPAWRGRGYAARALELLTQWAFDDLGLPRLVLEIDEENVASIRVAERCGYVRDGVTTGDEPVKAVFVREREVVESRR